MNAASKGILMLEETLWDLQICLEDFDRFRFFVFVLFRRSATQKTSRHLPFGAELLWLWGARAKQPPILAPVLTSPRSVEMWWTKWVQWRSQCDFTMLQFWATLSYILIISNIILLQQAVNSDNSVAICWDMLCDARLAWNWLKSSLLKRSSPFASPAAW